MKNPAALYGVYDQAAHEQVRRNQRRFPADFVLQLTTEEHAALGSNFETSNIARRGVARLACGCTYVVACALTPVRSFHRIFLEVGFGESEIINI
ncbi:MAG: ORF6N domain-containing protein [Gammaproteobacteria bacterium]